MVLTAIANDRLHDEIHAKQVRAWTRRRRAAGDLRAETVGHRQGGGSRRDPRMTIVALTGYDGGELAGLLGQQDVESASPPIAARVSARCTLTVNCLCDLMHNTLFI